MRERERERERKKERKKEGRKDRKKERNRKKERGGIERHYIWGEARNYTSGLEGSQAVPACPSGMGNVYNRN
jgi:hypothetical protein